MEFCRIYTFSFLLVSLSLVCVKINNTTEEVTLPEGGEYMYSVDACEVYFDFLFTPSHCHRQSKLGELHQVV